MRATCRVLLPARLPLTIVLAAGGARARIYRLRVPIALEIEEAEAVVARFVVVRNEDIGRGPARHEAALGLVVQHRDELGAIVGLAAQRLVRDDARGSRLCRRSDSVAPPLPGGDA